MRLIPMNHAFDRIVMPCLWHPSVMGPVSVPVYLTDRRPSLCISCGCVRRCAGARRSTRARPPKRHCMREYSCPGRAKRALAASLTLMAPPIADPPPTDLIRSIHGKTTQRPARQDLHFRISNVLLHRLAQQRQPSSRPDPLLPAHRGGTTASTPMHPHSAAVKLDASSHGRNNVPRSPLPRNSAKSPTAKPAPRSLCPTHRTTAAHPTSAPHTRLPPRNNNTRPTNQPTHHIGRTQHRVPTSIQHPNS